jgi:hypothetical protein
MTIFPDIFVADGMGTEVGASVATATGVGVGVAVAGPHAADNATAIMTTNIITLWDFISYLLFIRSLFIIVLFEFELRNNYQD